MNPWFLLTKTASIANQIQKLREEIEGGVLTTVLTEIGAVEYESAITDLRQAQRSTDPRRHISSASSKLVTAYHAFDKAAKRGPSLNLRRFAGAGALRTTHEQAAGSAALVALLETHLGEEPSYRREWLDNVGRHVSEDWLDHHARKSNWLYEGVIGEDEMNRWVPFDAYFKLEERLLPASYIRERPLGWQTVGQLIEKYGKEQYQRLSMAGFFETPENIVLDYKPMLLEWLRNTP
jgi:hypothetical protein